MTTLIPPTPRRRSKPAFYVPAAVARQRQAPNDERARVAVTMLCYATLLALLVGFLFAESALGQEPPIDGAAAAASTDGGEAEATEPRTEGSAVLAQYPERWADDPGMRVRIPTARLANFDRLRRELSNEAAVEDLLEGGDRRDLVAVRAWVDRCGRVESCRLTDNPHEFDDGRDVLGQLAKESLREYVKQEIRWDQLQDRAKVRVRNFFTRGFSRLLSRAEAPRRAERVEAEADVGGDEGRFGSFEIAPQADLDLDDTELGIDFGYDPVRYGFLSDWELSYRERVQQDGRSFRLRYSGDDRWFDLIAAQDDDYRGDYVGLSVTQLF